MSDPGLLLGILANLAVVAVLGFAVGAGLQWVIRRVRTMNGIRS